MHSSCNYETIHSICNSHTSQYSSCLLIISMNCNIITVFMSCGIMLLLFLFLHAITEFASQASRVGIWFSERSYLVKKLRGDFNFLNLSLSLSPSLSVRWCTDWEWIDSLEFSANVEVVFCQTTLWQSRRSLLWWELEACSIHWLLQVNRHVVIWRLLLPEHDNLVKKKKSLSFTVLAARKVSGTKLP